MNCAEEIYQSLCGNLKKPIPGAESLYYEGSRCENAWGDISLAYESLRVRLGVEDEDRDVEDIMQAFLTIQHELALKMFEFGREYEKSL